MELGLQVSLSETFNIVSADFVNMEIPIVVSNEIEWAPDKLKTASTEIDKIVSKMEEVYFKTGVFYRKLLKIALQNYNKKSEKYWINYAK